MSDFSSSKKKKKNSSSSSSAADFFATKPPALCTYCQVRVPFSELMNHVAGHISRYDQLRCTDCSAPVLSLDDMDTHLLCYAKEALRPSATPFRCEFCAYRGEDLIGLHFHRNIMHDETDLHRQQQEQLSLPPTPIATTTEKGDLPLPLFAENNKRVDEKEKNRQQNRQQQNRSSEMGLLERPASTMSANEFGKKSRKRPSRWDVPFRVESEMEMPPPRQAMTPSSDLLTKAPSLMSGPIIPLSPPRPSSHHYNFPPPFLSQPPPPHQQSQQQEQRRSLPIFNQLHLQAAMFPPIAPSTMAKLHPDFVMPSPPVADVKQQATAHHVDPRLRAMAMRNGNNSNINGIGNDNHKAMLITPKVEHQSPSTPNLMITPPKKQRAAWMPNLSGGNNDHHRATPVSASSSTISSSDDPMMANVFNPSEFSAGVMAALEAHLRANAPTPPAMMSEVEQRRQREELFAVPLIDRRRHLLAAASPSIDSPADRLRIVSNPASPTYADAMMMDTSARDDIQLRSQQPIVESTGDAMVVQTSGVDSRYVQTTNTGDKVFRDMYRLVRRASQMNRDTHTLLERIGNYLRENMDSEPVEMD